MARIPLGNGAFGLQALAVDVSGNVYAAGRSEATWGNPINPYSGGTDGFVAKLNNTGGLEWNTFMGSSGWDGPEGIALDGSRNVYVAGSSEATWGTPLNPHGGGDSDAFAAKLDSSGVRQWHTFMGGTYGWDIAVDGGQNVYVTGVWGAAHPGFVAALNRDGVLQWNTFLEAILYSIALDGSRNVYLAGQIDFSWGTPVHPWAGGWDAFVAKIGSTTEIDIDIKPGSFPNNIDLRSRGVIPVAILTTGAFDATSVNPMSVRFGPSGAVEAHGPGHIEDADGDGDLDLVLHFRTPDTGITCGMSSAHLTGATFAGQAVAGSDSLKTVGCGAR